MAFSSNKTRSLSLEWQVLQDDELVTTVVIPFQMLNIRRLNIVMLGDKGTGKSALRDLLFLDMLTATGHYEDPNSDISGPTVQQFVLDTTDDGGGPLHIRVYELNGISSSGNQDKNIGYVQDFIDTREEESMSTQYLWGTELDVRVHMVFYFFEISAQRPFQLTEYSVKFMKMLGNYTNLVPVIGNDDKIRSDDVEPLKLEVRQQMMQAKIVCFSPDKNISDNIALQESMPIIVYSDVQKNGSSTANCFGHDDVARLIQFFVKQGATGIIEKQNQTSVIRDTCKAWRLEQDVEFQEIKTRQIMRERDTDHVHALLNDSLEEEDLALTEAIFD